VHIFCKRRAGNPYCRRNVRLFGTIGHHWHLMQWACSLWVAYLIGGISCSSSSLELVFPPQSKSASQGPLPHHALLHNQAWPGTADGSPAYSTQPCNHAADPRTWARWRAPPCCGCSWFGATCGQCLRGCPLQRSQPADKAPKMLWLCCVHAMLAGSLSLCQTCRHKPRKRAATRAFVLVLYTQKRSRSCWEGGQQNTPPTASHQEGNTFQHSFALGWFKKRTQWSWSTREANLWVMGVIDLQTIQCPQTASLWKARVRMCVRVCMCVFAYVCARVRAGQANY